MKLYYSIRNFFRFLVRLFHYLPLIWRDRDWDWEFILEILIFKLERTRDYLQVESWHTNHDRDVAQIQEVLDLFSKVKGGYSVNYDKLDERFGEMQHKFGEPDENGCVEYITWRPGGTEEEVRRATREAFDIDYREEKAIWGRAFGLMARNIKNWWS